jgi:hypothetical protein
MSNSKSSTSSGIGFPALLGLTFIILKLCNVIHWSWLWVLSPFWIGLAIVLIIFLLYVLVKILK